MTKRRSRGDGGLHWDEKRQRWIATITVGYDGSGKRITRKASGKTKTEAKDKLKEIQRNYDEGLITATTGYTEGYRKLSSASFRGSPFKLLVKF